ncbi:UPF0146 family protein [Halobacterium wangiae]|uniref:UPF0146 family protein n=1 Tax=Halobacterium wangiae TaxID=2902623 RepID=UPI001E2F033E|nr:UPF0146 family protein [Halobacterium wangiae]
MGKPPNVADVLAAFDRLVEVGVGRHTDVAAALAASGRAVTATDVHEREVPERVRFVVDDVTNPDPAVYADADAVYALNCPPELHRALLAVAEDADAACLFTTLGGDQPEVPVERRTVETGTLFVARTRN